MGPSGPRVVAAAFGHAFGVRVDGSLSRRFLRFFLTATTWLRVVVAAGAAVYRGPLRGPGSKGSKGSKGVVSPSAMNIKPALRAFLPAGQVILDRSADTTIGKPFYVQAKGQLRLTRSPYAGSPQSEESREAPPVTHPSVTIGRRKAAVWQSVQCRVSFRHDTPYTLCRSAAFPSRGHEGVTRFPFRRTGHSERSEESR